MSSSPADILTALREVRDAQPQGAGRSALNAACDRLDVAISVLAQPEPGGLPKCDCLDRCGDDPRLQANPPSVARCAPALKREAEFDQFVQLRQIEPEIALDAAQRAVVFSGTSHWIEGRCWYDTQLNRHGVKDYARAVTYLLLREEAYRHPEQPHLVRLHHHPFVKGSKK